MPSRFRLCTKWSTSLKVPTTQLTMVSGEFTLHFCQQNFMSQGVLWIAPSKCVCVTGVSFR